MVTRHGPVVLDWGWAAAGPPEFDVAHSWLQMETSEVPGSAPTRAAVTIGRRVFIRRFIEEFDVSSLRRALGQVATYRLEVRELTDRERRSIPGFVRRVTS